MSLERLARLYDSVLLIGSDSLLGKSLSRLLAEGGRVSLREITMDELDAQGESLLRERAARLAINTYNRGGGIGMIKKYPADVFLENLRMFPDILPCLHRHGVEKYVNILPNCIYPDLQSVPFREENLWLGYPEPTVAPYAMAKKISLVQTLAYRAQFDFNAINLIVTAQYGPQDHFGEDAQVIPSMILKYARAMREKASAITFWGSGLATREFIYADDAAQGVLVAAERYDAGDPINICTGEEVTILQLAEMLAGIFGYEGRIAWNRQGPEGSVRKCLSTEKMRLYLGFTPPTPLREGLRLTAEAYLREHPHG